MQLILLLLTQATVVYSQWYFGEEKQQTTTSIDTEDASKPIPATSSIECILECQQRLRASYFVEDTNQCFCVLSENDTLISKEGETLDGVFYQIDEFEVKIILIINRKGLKYQFCLLIF